MAIQLTASGPRIAKDAAWYAKKEEYAHHDSVVFEGFVAPPLLARIPRWLETSRYGYTVHRTGSRDLVMRRDQPLVAAFQILLNQARLFRAIAEFAGLEEDITCFEGHCSKQLPIDSHFGAWHNDVAATKHVGLSISLSPKPVQGGVFLLRRARTGEVFRQVPAGRLGDAHLFRLGRSLEHRVSAVGGKHARYVFSGAFRSGKSHREVLRNEFAPAARGQPR